MKRPTKKDIIKEGIKMMKFWNKHQHNGGYFTYDLLKILLAVEKLK